MADPMDAAANNEEDVGDLYADLDEQVAAALAAAGESGGSNARDSDQATDGEGEVPDADANEAVDLGDGTAGYSSSDEESDDGLRIVLNEDAGAPLPPPSVGRGEGCVAEGEEGEDSVCRVKGSSLNHGGRATVAGVQCKGILEKVTLPIMGQVDLGHQHVFRRDYNLSLPRNSTIFDIDIEVFQQKPWRQQGVDLTDYFNFGLDEEGWIKYWCSMNQLRLGSRSLANETSGLDQELYKLQSAKAMSMAANYSGFEGRNGLAKPKGRAIHVEGSVCERVPSVDLWRPVPRDSDVVIQVNMTLSPSNLSTSDDSSKLNHKCATTERMSDDHPGDKQLKGSSFVVDRVVDKVHDGCSSEYPGSKLDKRDSSSTWGQSTSSDDSGVLSDESKEEIYFKRANRHSNSRDFFEDTKFQDEHVKTNFYCHSRKSDNGNRERYSRSYTPPSDDRNHKATKLLGNGQAPFTGQGKSSDLFVECKSSRGLLKSVYKARKDQKRQILDCGRHAVFVEKERSTNMYPAMYDRKYEKRRSSYSRRTNYHSAVENQFCEKQDHSPLEKVALKNDEYYFSNGSNHRHRRSSCEISEGEDIKERFPSAKDWQHHRDHAYHSRLKTDMSDANDVRVYRERYYQEKRRARHDLNAISEGEENKERFPSAKDWQQHRDHVYHSRLKADMSDANVGRVHRERYYQEKRRARHDLNADEFPRYTDYGFCEWQSAELRGRYSKSNDGQLGHDKHLELYPSLKNSERDWPVAGFPFKNSRNRHINNKRICNAKIVQHHYNGHHQKIQQHDSSFHIGNIFRSALCTDTAAETSCFIQPVKRKLHSDLGSMNQKNLGDFSLLKGRRLMHDQSVVSDRRICALKVHQSTEEIDMKATCSSSDMRNSNTFSNSCIGRRLKLENANNIHLSDKKIKFERRGNELRRVIENDQKGRLPVDKVLHSSKYKHAHQNTCKQNMGYLHSGNQDLEKSALINQLNEEDMEIEEGELIDQSHQDIISESTLKPNKVVLKSVIETGSAEHLKVDSTMSENAVCNNGTTRECDNKHILEVMEKMQKRRERFKEAIARRNDDGNKKEILAVACGTNHIQNQRPARKRRWGGNSRMLEMS